MKSATLAVAKPATATRILIVDDDPAFRDRLVRAMISRGLQAEGAGDLASALHFARTQKVHRAVVDMRMPETTGLEVIRQLMRIDSDIDVVVLTGYGSIPTAVEAVRLGAIDYLTKPADTDQIIAAFERADDEVESVTEVESAPSLARVEWEHIQRVLSDCENNVSRAARTLGIHRRSLQRKLHKRPPLE